MTTFRIQWIVGTPPADVADRLDRCPGSEAMCAPRPLYGLTTALHPDWGWAGQVIAHGADEITHNHRQDATAVRWITEADAVTETVERVDREYGAGTADTLDHDDLIGLWVQHHQHDTVEL